MKELDRKSRTSGHEDVACARRWRWNYRSRPTLLVEKPTRCLPRSNLRAMVEFSKSTALPIPSLEALNDIYGRQPSPGHLMNIVFSSRYSSRLSINDSLPIPLPFHPPNGRSQHPVGLVQFTPTRPLSSFLPTLKARSMSFVYKAAYRPNSVS
jgi:hypothetical protein